MEVGRSRRVVKRSDDLEDPVRDRKDSRLGVPEKDGELSDDERSINIDEASGEEENGSIG